MSAGAYYNRTYERLNQDGTYEIFFMWINLSELV